DPAFDAPTPVAVVDGKAIADSGFTVLGDALTNLPQALVTTNLQNTSGTLFNIGQSRINLRELGSARTLVLVDGRRHLTGDFNTSAVDLNIIPSSMIERVEAISGGASAVYGSEAIAGVVNIILKKKYDGVVLDATGGMTEHDDGKEWKASIGYGMPFAGGRGSFLVGAEYGKVEPVYQVDRSWAFPGVRRDNTVAPQTIVPASRSNVIPTATFQLVAGNGAGARSIAIAPDRSTSYVDSAACRTATVLPSCQDPWLFYTATYNALRGQEDRKTLRAYADFDFTDNLKWFGDISAAQVHGLAIFQPAFSTNVGGGLLPVTLHGDNAYLNGPGALAALIRSQWSSALGGAAVPANATANVGKFWGEFGLRDSDVTRDGYRAVTGLEGKLSLFGRDVDWEVYGQYSELRGVTIAFAVPNTTRLVQATDAVVVGGQIVCRDPAAQAAGCQPWDLINGPSQAAIDWANAQARTDGKASQTVFGASASGSFFELPAGPLAVAVGAEYRKETSDQIEDPLAASGALFYNAIQETKGGYNIKEGFAEVQVPIVKDLPALHLFSVELAGRLGDYSSVGSVNQWRMQATWYPLEDVEFRWSNARSVRAPNIAELYAPQSQNFTNTANDPCDKAQITAIASNPTQQQIRIANCAAVIPGYNSATFVSNIGAGRPSLQLLQGGNPSLNEESASTLTVGTVLKPRFLNNFNLSLDYWRIKVDDAVSTIPINTLLANLCYDAPQAPSGNRFCSLIIRDPSGASTGLVGGISQVIITNQNVQAIETSGYDLSVEYSHDFGNVGLFQIRGDLTKVIRWDLQGIPGGPVTHFGGVITNDVPTHKAQGTLGWTRGDFNLQWQTHYQDSYGVSETDPPSSRTPFFTGAYFSHDLRGSYHLTDALAVRAGVINITDENPPILPEVGNATGVGSTYDNRGRWYYIGVNYEFGKSK
ncbi:MAG TPA: TonB-dependent receptor, partial [Steroidobacteraceae bacterium]|nr:TonB-dependent receptor [Steroidobacteraceae bacterium]